MSTLLIIIVMLLVGEKAYYWIGNAISSDLDKTAKVFAVGLIILISLLLMDGIYILMA